MSARSNVNHPAGIPISKMLGLYHFQIWNNLLYLS